MKGTVWTVKVQFLFQTQTCWINMSDQVELKGLKQHLKKVTFIKGTEAFLSFGSPENHGESWGPGPEKKSCRLSQSYDSTLGTFDQHLLLLRPWRFLGSVGHRAPLWNTEVCLMWSSVRGDRWLQAQHRGASGNPILLGAGGGPGGDEDPREVSGEETPTGDKRSCHVTERDAMTWKCCFLHQTQCGRPIAVPMGTSWELWDS